MKIGARVALGVGVGYLLGRTRKMRLALTLAAAGASGTLGKSPGGLLRGGASALASSPEVAKMTERVREELVTAVKAAAVSAASGRIDSLSNRIQTGGAKAEDKEGEDKGDAPSDTDSNADDKEPHTEDDDKPEASEHEEASSKSSPRQSKARRKPEEGSDESKERPRARARASRASSSDRSPVRRTRR